MMHFCHLSFFKRNIIKKTTLSLTDNHLMQKKNMNRKSVYPDNNNSKPKIIVCIIFFLYLFSFHPVDEHWGVVV